MSTEECKVNWGSGCTTYGGGAHHCQEGSLHSGNHVCWCGTVK